jgi:hypothetical protein
VPAALLLSLEVLFVIVLLAGVAMLSIPAGLILGGFLGVVACERATTRRELAS